MFWGGVDIASFLLADEMSGGLQSAPPRFCGRCSLALVLSR